MTIDIKFSNKKLKKFNVRIFFFSGSVNSWRVISSDVSKMNFRLDFFSTCVLSCCVQTQVKHIPCVDPPVSITNPKYALAKRQLLLQYSPPSLELERILENQLLSIESDDVHQTYHPFQTSLSMHLLLIISVGECRSVHITSALVQWSVATWQHAHRSPFSYLDQSATSHVPVSSGLTIAEFVW